MNPEENSLQDDVAVSEQLISNNDRIARVPSSSYVKRASSSTSITNRNDGLLPKQEFAQVRSIDENEAEPSPSNTDTTNSQNSQNSQLSNQSTNTNNTNTSTNTNTNINVTIADDNHENESKNNNNNTKKDTNSDNNDGKDGNNPNNPNNPNNSKNPEIAENWPIFEPFAGPYALSVYKKDYLQIKNEILVGIVVGCAQIPESVAFAFIAGVEPSIGLHAAWIIGFIVAFTGNRPGLISGATGAMAAILMGPIKEFGVEYLFYTVILKGIIQTVVSFMGFEKVANLVPYTTNIGFVNGLAIIIGLGQINNFKIPDDKINDFPEGDIYVTGSTLGLMIFLSLLTFAIIEVLPKFTKVVPSSLVAITMATVIEHLIFRTAHIGETVLIGDISTLSDGFPKIIFWDNKYVLPSLLEWKTWQIITPPAILTALVGMIECVMTIEVIDDLSNTRHLPVTQQLASAGVANFISGFFGTMGGGATIGLSMICIHSGANGRYRISGCVAAVFLLCVILIASKLLEIVPTSALIGVMLVVVIHTFEWGSLIIVLISCMPMKMRAYVGNRVKKFKFMEDWRNDRKIGRNDAFVIVMVTVLTLVFDLAISVIFGVLFSSFWYVWQGSKQCKVTREQVYTEEEKSLRHKKGDVSDSVQDRAIYLIDGALFFGNAHWIRKQFNFKNDPERIEIHLNDAEIMDYSAMQALNFIGEKYKKLGKNVKLKHVNTQSHKLITKAKDLFIHFEYETVTTIKDEGDIHFSTPDRLHVINTKA